jgi:D-serine deaminase-like pyridoxal phosphate-dependent protein
MDVSALPTPSILIDRTRLDRNLARMQDICAESGTRLRPHIKTHKSVAIARRQLERGADGLTVAKIGEAEAIIPSGVRRIFIAHSLVDPGITRRLAALDGQLEELVLAVTSEPQAEALNTLLVKAGLKLPVWLAVDTGLGREGVRDPESARRLATRFTNFSCLQLSGLYTHEGQFYRSPPTARLALIDQLHERLIAYRDAIDPELPLWPGCSVTAALLAGREGITGVRPGAYVFADLALAETTGVQGLEDVALNVLSTVIDRPEPGLALVDSGTKTLSSDKTRKGIHARPTDGRGFWISNANEEHGYVEGPDVDQLRIGEKIRWIPAHVCPVVNLTDRLVVVDGDEIVDTWPVDARGRVQ